MLKKEEKVDLIKDFKTHERDTGSSQVQIILLSEKINDLATHLKDHPKDFHSKRGLVQMVVKRKKLLAYLKKEDEKSYKDVAKQIGIKK